MRDVNNQSHWAMNKPADFDVGLSPTLVWNDDCNGLSLAPSAMVEPTSATKIEMRARANQSAMAVDTFGTWARVEDGAPSQIVSGGAGLATEVIFEAGEGAQIIDFEWSARGDLLVIWRASGRNHVTWVDMLDRFDPIEFENLPFEPDRVVAAPDMSDLWLVRRSTARIALIKGDPVPAPIAAFIRPDSGFDPDPIAPNMPRVEALETALNAAPAILDVAALTDGALAILREGAGAAGENQIDWLHSDGRFQNTRLDGVRRAFSMCTHNGNRVAITTPDWTEARVFSPPVATAPDGVMIPPGRARIPLRGWTGGRLCNGVSPMGCYPKNAQGEETPWANLAALSFAAFKDQGAVTLSAIDTGLDGFVWHRIYIEADIPKGTQIKVFAQSWDRDEEDLNEEGLPQHLHIFGSVEEAGTTPRGVWVDMPSEHAHGKNHLPNPERRKDRTGLFTCLMQSTQRDQTRIEGRFLRLRVELVGNGAATPRLYALRVWGPRFSYRDKYLPELYTITKGPGALGSDFLDRFLGMFESVLTPMEGEIAQTWRGASAQSAPADALDWLGGWLGVTPDSALGEAGKRRLIAGAAEQSKWHGTLRGLETALDIATDGGVRYGRVVVLENFVLRRTFATILGADFDDRDDPLTRGTRGNANSMLGPGFFVGHEDEKTLFALLRPEVLEHDLTDPGERAEAARQLEEFEDDAAFKVTVLVHDGTDGRERGLISNVIGREVPSHVSAEIFDAPQSLLLGLTALLGVETRLGPPITAPNFTLDGSELGQAHLRGIPALDPRLQP
ncbi:MAG: phage tail protein [Sulfitobacter sp.]